MDWEVEGLDARRRWELDCVGHEDLLRGCACTTGLHGVAAIDGLAAVNTTAVAKIAAVVALIACVLTECAAQQTDFRKVTATDETYSAELPSAWQIGSANLKQTVARSADGQSVAWGTVAVIDEQHFGQYQQLLGPQFARSAAQVFPVVANPMPAEQVIVALTPQFNPAVQGIRNIGARTVSPRESFVVYEYELGGTAMKGEALVYMNPPQPGGYGIWSIIYWRAEAPTKIFSQSEAVFEHVFMSLHYDLKRILDMIQENAQLQREIVGGIAQGEANEYQQRSQMITQFGQNMQQMQMSLYNTFQTQNLKSGEGAIASLGGAHKFVDGNGTEFDFNLHQKSNLYNCVNGWGAAAVYYGSDAQNCMELGAAAGVDLRPIKAE